MKTQIPIDTTEKLIQAINTTKNFLNHDFLNYIKTSKSVNPSEWAWVTQAFSVIYGEKPNLPNEIYSRLENLYLYIFQIEANNFLELLRRFSEEGITDLKNDNAKQFELQYNKWRTDFTVEANKVINDLRGSNDCSAENDLELLKGLVVKGDVDTVINQLIELYQGSIEDQNILYGLSFRVRKWRREDINGILRNEEKELELNKIINSVLKMIDGLKK